MGPMPRCVRIACGLRWPVLWKAVSYRGGSPTKHWKVLCVCVVLPLVGSGAKCVHQCSPHHVASAPWRARGPYKTYQLVSPRGGGHLST